MTANFFASPSPTRKQAGRAQGIVLILAATLSVMGILVVAPILPQLLERYADVPGIAFLGPMLLTVPALCIALFAPAAGLVVDRFGRRRTLIVAMLLYAPLGAAPMLLDNIWTILATRVGVGIMEAIIMTASTTLIGDYFDGKRRDTWLAWQVGISSVSAVVLLLIGGLLGSIDWRAPFAVYLTAWVLAIATLLLTWEPDRSSGGGENHDRPTVAFPGRLIALICAITVFGGVIFYIVPVQLGLVLGGLGITSPAIIGASTAAGSLVVALGSILFRRYSNIRLGLMLGGALLLAGIGLVIIGLGRSFEVIMVGVVINQMGCGLILPTLLAWAMAPLAQEWRGRGIGFWTGAFFIGQFVSPILLTAGAKGLGSIGNAAVACGAVAVIGAVISLALGFRTMRPIGVGRTSDAT